MRKVSVATAQPYDILIEDGLLAQAGTRTRECHGTCRAMLVTDDRVEGLYGSAVAAAYHEAGFEVSRFAFPNGEGSKTWQTLGALLEAMARAGMTRGDAVVALGGGVVGDMAGFAAAVYARGLRWVQLPTTLLAAVDSSVGGKTAVDLSAGKNLAGAFWQPSLVLCDTQVLCDLPEPLLRDGLAEIIKYGVLADPALFARMAQGRLMACMPETVEACVRIKRDLVEGDERDNGKRQLLNLGHTFGHAVEQCSGYALSHGQAVAIGLAVMARGAQGMGLARAGLAAEIEAALTACGLPIHCPYDAQALLDVARLDKKRQGDRITLVVPLAVGECVLRKEPADALLEWLRLGLEARACE